MNLNKKCLNPSYNNLLLHFPELVQSEMTCWSVGHYSPVLMDGARWRGKEAETCLDGAPKAGAWQGKRRSRNAQGELNQCKAAQLWDEAA